MTGRELFDTWHPALSWAALDAGSRAAWNEAATVTDASNTQQTFHLTCACCGNSDEVGEDPKAGVYSCDRCGAAISFGVPMPRFKVMPHEDRRFIVVTVSWGQDGKEGAGAVDFTLERNYAAGVALDVLSVTDQAKWNAIEAIASAFAVPTPPSLRVEGVRVPHPIPATEPEPSPPTVRQLPAVEPVVLGDDGEGLCHCGNPSTRMNGACERCFVAALGGPS